MARPWQCYYEARRNTETITHAHLSRIASSTREAPAAELIPSTCSHTRGYEWRLPDKAQPSLGKHA